MTEQGGAAEGTDAGAAASIAPGGAGGSVAAGGSGAGWLPSAARCLIHRAVEEAVMTVLGVALGIVLSIGVQYLICRHFGRGVLAVVTAISCCCIALIAWHVTSMEGNACNGCYPHCQGCELANLSRGYVAITLGLAALLLSFSGIFVGWCTRAVE